MAKRASQPTSLVVRRGQAIYAVPDMEDGEEVTRLFTDESELLDVPTREITKRALEAIGSWSDLDADEVLDALDRIRHDSKPTPPIDDL